MTSDAATDKKTILIVDDTAANISLISTLLNAVYRTKVATNGQKALNIAASEHPPDLILLDIMMPEIDGYEVCRRLKADEKTRHIPIIFLTAMTQAEDEEKGLMLGAVDYITKPISPAILMARVRTHIELKEANDRLLRENDLLEQKVQERTRELSLTNQSLARFVPDEFLSALGRDNILKVQLGDCAYGTMTVLFSDIRSYTTLAEAMSPQETFAFLNGYLSRMGPVIREHQGFVNQFTGDGIMAIFPNAPDDAVHAGIRMQQTVAAYNQERQTKNRQPIRIGIGLNTGPLMLGIIGDGYRTDSGVVADTVNISARMESLTKYYGVGIIAGETTFAGLADPRQYHSRLLDKVQMKGKRLHTPIYEIFDADQESVFERKTKTLPIFELGQEHYFGGEFAEALKCFTDVLTVLPEDLTTKHYLERSSKFLLEGVPEDWQGIRIMDTK
jgi:CheY-like chemotaxis protein